MKTLLLTATLLTCALTINAQTITFHQLRLTDSGNEVIRWNIPKDSLSYFKDYVEETTDRQGRSVQLRFLQNGKYLKNTLCDFCDKVRFEYPDSNTIIQLSYDGDTAKPNALWCGMPYKCTYTYNKDYIIINAHLEFNLDTTGVPKAQIEGAQKEIEKLTADSPEVEGFREEVPYYVKSYSKLNRHFPVSIRVLALKIESENVEALDVIKCLPKK